MDARGRRARVLRDGHRPRRRARPDVAPRRQVARHGRRRGRWTPPVSIPRDGASVRVGALAAVRRGGRRARPSFRVFPGTGSTRRTGTDERRSNCAGSIASSWNTTIFEPRWSGAWRPIGPGDEGAGAGGALHWFWLKRAYLAEGQHWLERALARSAAPPPARRAQALMALGSIVFFQGDFERAHASARGERGAGARRRRALDRGGRPRVADDGGDRARGFRGRRRAGR